MEDTATATFVGSVPVQQSVLDDLNYQINRDKYLDNLEAAKGTGLNVQVELAEKQLARLESAKSALAYPEVISPDKDEPYSSRAINAGSLGPRTVVAQLSKTGLFGRKKIVSETRYYSSTEVEKFELPIPAHVLESYSKAKSLEIFGRFEIWERREDIHSAYDHDGRFVEADPYLIGVVLGVGKTLDRFFVIDSWEEDEPTP